MPRFLFVVPPLVGHINPTVSVARELSLRGHEVAWAAHDEARKHLPEGARVLPLAHHVTDDAFERGAREATAARGLAALKLLWEGFLIPLAKSMQQGVLEAARAFAPDVMIVDQQALAGALVARRLGLPWATFASTAAGVTDPLAALPMVKAWLDEKLADLQREAGLDPLDPPDRSPSLVVVFSTEALVGPLDRFPSHYRFVGPSVHLREETTPFPWAELASMPRVLVSLGTIPAEGSARFYDATARAFEGASMQAIVVAPEGAIAARPPLIVRPFVPQLALLAHVDAVVSHAGQNTVSESLAAGKPLVVLPIKYDQSVIAQQVEASGAGLRLRFGRVRPDELRQAITRVLEEPSFRERALAAKASFERAGGAKSAADALETLL